VFVYDLVESAVVDRAYDIIVVCHVDDGWLLEVIPFLLRLRRGGVWASVPVFVVPPDPLPEEICVRMVPYDV
jgi:hypothetical protein